MSIENLKTFDPFAEADEGTGEKSSAQSQDYIHIRIQRTYSLLRPHAFAQPAASPDRPPRPPKTLTFLIGRRSVARNLHGYSLTRFRAQWT
jgi:hypothetical protein